MGMNGKLNRYARLLIVCALLPLAIFVSSSSNVREKTLDNPSAPVPVYNIKISRDTQLDIWKLCGEYNLSYELVLAIFQVDGLYDAPFYNIKIEIAYLADLRSYWTKYGLPEEIVYKLMLVAYQRGIEGCIEYMKDGGQNSSDDFISKVTDYKYHLEQSR